MDDYEYFTKVHGMYVGVNKIGGGTLGKSYSQGNWEVTVQNGDEFVFDKELMYYGMPKTHAEVASLAADFASEEIDGE